MIDATNQLLEEEIARITTDLFKINGKLIGDEINETKAKRMIAERIIEGRETIKHIIVEGKLP